MTAHLFRSKLRAIGIEAIPAMGQLVDPNLAQAVGMVAVNDAARDGIVVEELQIGYTMRGQLLLPPRCASARPAEKYKRGATSENPGLCVTLS